MGVGVGDAVAVGIGLIIGVGVGVGGGGDGVGMIKTTILRTTTKLRIPKAIWRVLTCDLREPRFTVYLLMQWTPVRNPFPFLDLIIP